MSITFFIPVATGRDINLLVNICLPSIHYFYQGDYKIFICVADKDYDLLQLHLKIKDNITKQNFLYAFSKVVFSLWEVFLLLDNNYSASNFKRNELLKSNKYAIKLKSFVELHEKMHNFRYNNDIPEKINYNNYKKNWFNLIVYWYKTIFKELFWCWKVKCTQFSKIKAIWISFFANRILYTLNLFFHFKRVNIYFLKEPFIDFVERYIMFSDNIVNKKKVYQKDLDILIQDWKTASWLYYYK